MSEKVSNVRSIERAFSLLECFKQDKPELSFIELSQLTGLSPSTVHRIVSTLERNSYLERSIDNKKYYLGYKVIQLGNISSYNLNSNLRKIAYPSLSELKDIHNETASIYVVNNGYRICIERVETTYDLRRVINIGDRLPLDAGAPGRLLLAHMEKDVAQKIISDNKKLTDYHLAELRSKGYAVSDGERAEGVASIAAPVFDYNNKAIAAISLSGPSTRIIKKDITDKISSVINAAKKISRKLGWEDIVL
ncbi:MAG: IclR family transcriptional regulator [Clostridiales bacterium]|nr:IclR family transcriptional regulator [Clostridiales bacterium]